MHTNWHSDDSDGASWMDEQGSEGRSSSLTHPNFLLGPQSTPSHQPHDDITISLQAIQFDIEMWNDMYSVSAPYISPSQQDAWKSIVAKVEHVSRQIQQGGLKDRSHVVDDTPAATPAPSTTGRPRRHSSIVSDAQPESYWAGLWYLLGDVENDRNRRLGVEMERTMPGDAYVLLQIWSCLDSKDFAAVAAVCSDWFRLVYHSKLGQRQWQHMACSRWPQIREWESPFVQRVCGTTTDWRDRFVSLHKLDSKWRTGAVHTSSTALPPTPAIRCMHCVGQTRLLLMGTSRGELQVMDMGRATEPTASVAHSTQQVHNFSISAIASCGDRAVSGSADGSLVVHDVAVASGGGSSSRPLPLGHFDGITSVEMREDVVVSSSKDASVRLWDLRSAGRHVVFEDPTRRESVVQATFLPRDPFKFLAFYADGACCVWDARNTATPWQRITASVQCKAFAWLSDSTCAVVEGQGRVALLKDTAVVARFTRPSQAVPLACFPIFHGSASSRGVAAFGVATTDPHHAVEVYIDPTTTSSHTPVAPTYSLAVPTALRCCAADWASIVGVDGTGHVHELSFLPR